MKLMRSVPRHLAFLAVAGLVTQPIACGGSADDTAPAPSEGQRADIAYDGDVVFRGVFFNDGPVAPLLSELWDSPQIQGAKEQIRRSTPEEIQRRAAEQMRAAGVSTEASEKLSSLAGQGQALSEAPRAASAEGSLSPAQIADDIIASMQKADPAFFPRFGEDMQSGDHLRVAAAVKEAARRLLEEMGSRVDLHPGTFIDGQGSHNWHFAINYVGVFNVVTAATVAAAAAVVVVAAVAVVVVFAGARPWRPGADSGLEPDHGLERDMAINHLTVRLAR